MIKKWAVGRAGKRESVYTLLPQSCDEGGPGGVASGSCGESRRCPGEKDGKKG